MQKRKFDVISPDIWKNEKAIDVFQKMADGIYPAPPISKLFGFGITEVSPGKIVFEGKAKSDFYNPMGVTHGGFISTLLDSTMACAIQSLVELGKGSTSVELKVNFVRPVFEKTGKLKAIGEAVNVGRQIGSAEGRLIGEDGKLYAHGTTTCFIFDL